MAKKKLNENTRIAWAANVANLFEYSPTYRALGFGVPALGKEIGKSGGDKTRVYWIDVVKNTTTATEWADWGDFKSAVRKALAAWGLEDASRDLNKERTQKVLNTVATVLGIVAAAAGAVAAGQTQVLGIAIPKAAVTAIAASAGGLATAAEVAKFAAGAYADGTFDMDDLASALLQVGVDAEVVNLILDAVELDDLPAEDDDEPVAPASQRTRSDTAMSRPGTTSSSSSSSGGARKAAPVVAGGLAGAVAAGLLFSGAWLPIAVGSGAGALFGAWASGGTS